MKPWVLLASIVLWFSPPASAQLVIGTFDETRGGAGSLLSTSAAGELQNVLGSYSCATVTASPSLSPAFLSGVDVLWLSVVFDSTTPVTALSPSEQSALSDFIDAGGGALLYTDNDAQFRVSGQSFVGPFGLTTVGLLSSMQNVTVTSPSSTPVTSGPFGLVSSYTVIFPGWYSELGIAQSLATLDANGETALAWVPPGQISPTAGGLVFFSDASLDASSTALRLNAISAVGGACASVPAVSVGGLALLTLLLLAAGSFVLRFVLVAPPRN